MQIKFSHREDFAFNEGHPPNKVKSKVKGGGQECPPHMVLVAVFADF